ncbi:MAG: hypothetical protein JXA71_04625, partial [Chitinispirillaceae bacterium]|nr:hypothetical protein [Chitinispirillaceae bacterium]
RSAAGLAALNAWGKGARKKTCRRLVALHVRPEPLTELGVVLGTCRLVHAMMDLSDGLSKDARTLCHENGLGLDLTLDQLRPPRDMAALSRELGVPWQEWALHGGEEYTLLFAAAPAFDSADLPEPYRQPLVRLGTFTDRHRDLVLESNGRRAVVSRKSWDHAG